MLYIDDANTRMMNYKNGDIDLCFFSTSLLTQYEAKEDTIAADRQLVRTDFATIPVVWPKTPYVLREGYDGLSVLVNFHYKDMSKSA